MHKLARLIEKYANLIIILVAIITAVMGYYALQIEIEAGIKDMLTGNNPVVKTFDNVFDTFGGGMAYAVIMIEDKEIVDLKTLKKIDKLTDELDKVKGVGNVKSLTNLKKIKGTLTGIEVKKFIDKLPETEKECREIKNELLAEDQYMGKIITDDFKSTVLLVDIENRDNPEEVVSRIKKVLPQFEGPEKIYNTGSPVMVTDATNYMKRDLSWLLPFVILTIMLILYLSFRSFRGVLLPLSTVIISVIWTIGLLSLTGKTLSLISTILPVLLVSVGSAYAIHIVARYYENLNNGYDKSNAVINSVKKVGIAVIMAGGTTMIGFASLFLSDLTIIQDFALGTASGIGIALVISIIFIPAVLFKLSKPEHLKAAQKRVISTNFFRVINNIVLKRRLLVIIIVVILIIASAIVIPRLKPETNYISYFKESSPTRVATELVDNKFGGTQPVDVVIQGNIKDPELLKRMRDFQDEIEGLKHVNNPLSMVTLFREENQALHGGQEEMKVIPTEKNKIAQYLLLLEMSDKELLENFLTFDYKTTRIQMTMETLSSKKQDKIISELRDLIDKHFGDRYRVKLTGVPLLASEITDLVVSGQIKSLLSAIMATFLVTSLLLKSFKRGFFCSLPIALTVLTNFGIMGWFGISLDIATVMIASIAIGIGVDYSIHIFTRYLEEKEEGRDPTGALKTAIFTVGRANLYNALAVIAGFCIILLSSFPPLISFGGLTAITMVISFAGALIILPSLIISTINLVETTRQKINNRG